MPRQIDISIITESCGSSTTPVVYKDILYVAEWSSYFRALSPKSGIELWSYKANGPIMSSPIINDEIIYFGCHDNYVYALSTKGSLLWKFRTGNSIASSPAVGGGKICIGSSDNCVYALDRKTGNETWRFRTGDEVVGDILFHAERIYFGSMDSYFYCLDLNGNFVWKFKTGDSIITGRPVADDKKVYFTSTDENIYAVSLDGSFVWGFRTGDALSDKPVLKDGVLYCGSRDGYLYALSTESGQCLWRFNTASGVPVASIPLITNNAVYFGCNKFYALDLDGFLLWSFQTGDVMAAEPIIYNGKIIFGCLDGHIRALSLKGKVLWDIPTKSAVKLAGFGFVHPPKNNPKFLEERAEQLGLGVQEFAKKITEFKPYTFKPDSDIRSYISSDAERYVGVDESVGTYRPRGIGEYSPAERKKKRETDKLLKDQFGIEY